MGDQVHVDASGLHAVVEKGLVEPYARAFVRYPQSCFGGCCCTIFALAVLSIMTGQMAISEDESAWLVFDAEQTRTFKAWSDARWQANGRPPKDRRLLAVPGTRQRKAAGEVRRLNENSTQGGDQPPPGAENGGLVEMPFGNDKDWWSLTMIFKSDLDASESVFTPTRVQAMCQLEALLIKQPKVWVFRDSPLPFFYNGTDNWMQCPLLADAKVSEVVQSMYDSVSVEGPDSLYARFVQPAFAASGKSAYTRTSLFIYGGEGVDEEDHQKKVVDDVLLPHLGLSYGFEFGFKSALQVEEDRFQPYNDIRVRLAFNSNEFQAMVSQDFVLSVGAIIIVALIMWFHLNSGFLAAVGMFQIVFSLPVSALFYGGLFMVDYFEFLHILVVYLVLGIGADDVFVLTDTFRHISAESPIPSDQHYSDADLMKVLKHSLMRSGQAIFNTSFTTTVAFLSTSVSKVMPMRTCGYYAAICITMNYIFTLTLYPGALVIYHRRLQSKRCCCPSPKQKPEADSRKADSAADESERKRGCSLATCIEAFLEKAYIPFMKVKVGSVNVNALLIAAIMLGVAAQGAYYTSQLTPPRKPEVWIPDNHMLLEVGQFMSDTLYEADYEKYNIIAFVWGIKGLDSTGFDQYHPHDTAGVAEFDTDFDITTHEAQEHILEVCRAMQTLPCDLDGCTGYGSTLQFMSQEKAHSCFLEDLVAWNGGGALPEGQHFVDLLQRFQQEVLLGSPSDDNGQEYSSEVCQAEASDIGFIDGELKYVSVKLRTRMYEDTAFATGTEIRDLLSDFTDEWNGKAPAGVQGMKYHADGMFARYDLSQELLRGLFGGIAIAFPLSFLVLLSSTRNIVVSFYAVFCVGAIVACVLGFCKSAMDWDLGIGEAIAGVIVIGYSVDYVVHLAHIYTEASSYGLQTREERAEFAVKNMGSTIFAGAITTAGSGMIMFLCFLRFFYKMAVLISVTIMFSLLFSMGLFVALLWLIGPQYNCGDICNCFHRSSSPQAQGDQGTGAGEEQRGSGEEKTNADVKIQSV